MASFGENLRREREMRGVTLEEIAAATKISVRFLQAIEAEQFSKLPGGIFARSFIRAFAKYLGLDEDRVLAEYQLTAEPTPDLDLQRIVASRPAPRSATSRAGWLAFGIAAAMLTGGYLLFRYSHGEPEQRANLPLPQSTTASPSPAAPAQPAAHPGPTATPITGGAPPAHPPANVTLANPATSSLRSPVGNETGPAPAPVRRLDTGSGLVLQVAATERAWVAVDADGKTTLQRVLNPNEVETLKAKDSFSVTTGNAQGIILTLNGETLKPLGRLGEVKSIRLTAEDLKTSAP